LLCAGFDSFGVEGRKAGALQPSLNASVKPIPLRLAAALAARNALAAHLGAGDALLVVGHRFAGFRAKFTGLGARLAADSHHRAFAAANGDAELAELGAVKTGLHARGGGFVSGRREIGAMGVASKACGQTLGTVFDAASAAVACVLLVIVGPCGIRTHRRSGGADSSHHRSSIHETTPSF